MTNNVIEVQVANFKPSKPPKPQRKQEERIVNMSNIIKVKDILNNQIVDYYGFVMVDDELYMVTVGHDSGFVLKQASYYKIMTEEVE